MPKTARTRRPINEPSQENSAQPPESSVTDAPIIVAQRERILSESASLFAQRGYHATGIAEISRAVKLTRGALYYHIEGKEGLLYDICRTQIERIVPVATEIVGRDLPVIDRLRLLARAQLRNITDHVDEWAVFFAEFRSLTPDHRAEVIAARDTYEKLWEDLLVEGANTGELRKVPTLLAKGILGMFNYTYIWFRSSGAITPEDLADSFVDLLLNGLRAMP